MTRLAIAVLVLLPVSVALFDLSAMAALVLTLAVCAAIWIERLISLRKNPANADIVLETISASHFAEKVRWCLDRLALDYREDRSCGTFRAFYLGKTVPRLRLRTGTATSEIGNSADILRYLWGRHATESRAEFLQPTAERLALEKTLDRAGRMLQIWAYYHVLDDEQQTARLWGAEDPEVPAWQRALVKPLLPIQRMLIRRAFGISRERYQKACESIEAVWGDIEPKLADGRQSILGPALNYTDLTFAAMTGLWLQPHGYGGDNGIHVRMTRVPDAMLNDVERWKADFPKAVAFTEALYARRKETQEGD